MLNKIYLEPLVWQTSGNIIPEELYRYQYAGILALQLERKIPEREHKWRYFFIK